MSSDVVSLEQMKHLFTGKIIKHRKALILLSLMMDLLIRRTSKERKH